MAGNDSAGKFLKAILEKNRLTKKDIAKKLGVSISVVDRWINDQLEVPGRRFEEVARAFKMDEEEKEQLRELVKITYY